MSLDEKKISLMHKGKMAEIAFGYFDKMLEEEKNKLLSKLKYCVRHGEHDLIKYTSFVSGMNAIEDIQLNIRKDISAAQKIEEDTINGIT